MAQTTWRKELEDARKQTGDESPIVAVAPHEGVLDRAFHGGYGLAEGDEVAIWTESHVYFPIVYDGAEWLGAAPRNPTSEGLAHQGGQ